MIDWHSHILPAVDDGSRNAEESIKLLELLAEQGVKTVVATPHFIADNESVEDFLRRRSSSFNELKNLIQIVSHKFFWGLRLSIIRE